MWDLTQTFVAESEEEPTSKFKTVPSWLSHVSQARTAYGFCQDEDEICSISTSTLLLFLSLLLIWHLHYSPDSIYFAVLANSSNLPPSAPPNHGLQGSQDATWFAQFVT